MGGGYLLHPSWHPAIISRCLGPLASSSASRERVLPAEFFEPQVPSAAKLGKS